MRGIPSGPSTAAPSGRAAGIVKLRLVNKPEAVDLEPRHCLIVPKSQLRGFSARPAFLLGASLEHGLAAHHHIQAADCSAVIAIEEYHPVDPSSDPLPTRRSVRGQRTGMAFSSLASGRTTCRRMSSARVFSSSRPSSRRSPACASSYSNRWLSKAQELCWTSKGPSGRRLGLLPAGNARIKPEVQSEQRSGGASQGQFRVGADRCWLFDARNGYVHARNRNPKECGAFPESSLLGPRVIRSSVARTAFVPGADRHADDLARQARPFLEIGLPVHKIPLRISGAALAIAWRSTRKTSGRSPSSAHARKGPHRTSQVRPICARHQPELLCILRLVSD